MSFIHIQKTDVKKQLVYGVVYAPNILDAHQDLMTEEEIEKAAHHFLRTANLAKSIDKDHDHWPTQSAPVESFIAREGDPDFVPGSWVLGVKIDDAALWEQVEKGEINGFSFEGMAIRTPVMVEYDYLPTLIGITDAAPDGHTHSYMVKIDEDGKPIYGTTSVALDGHSHEITRGTATGETDGHKHRINLKVH